MGEPASVSVFGNLVTRFDELSSINRRAWSNAVLKRNTAASRRVGMRRSMGMLGIPDMIAELMKHELLADCNRILSADATI